FFFQAEDGIRDDLVTGVQTCALPIWEMLFAIGSERSRLRCNSLGAQPYELTSCRRFRSRTHWPASARPTRSPSSSFRPRCLSERSEERRVGKEWECRRDR